MKKKINNWEEDRFWIIDDNGIGHSGKLHPISIYKLKRLFNQKKIKKKENPLLTNG